jgi:phosphotransferase system HPr-like phosphotransfer protein
LSKIAKDLQEEDIQIMLGRDKEHLVSAASALRMLTLKIAFGEEIIVELGTDNSQRADEIFLLVAEAFAAE